MVLIRWTFTSFITGIRNWHISKLGLSDYYKLCSDWFRIGHVAKLSQSVFIPASHQEIPSFHSTAPTARGGAHSRSPTEKETDTDKHRNERWKEEKNKDDII